MDYKLEEKIAAEIERLRELKRMCKDIAYKVFLGKQIKKLQKKLAEIVGLK